MKALADYVLLFSPILYAAALAMCALAAGDRFAARLVGRGEDAGAFAARDGESQALRMALALPLGLGLLAQALFFLGVAGLFGAGAMAVVAGLALGAGGRILSANGSRRPPSASSAPRRRTRLALGALGALACAGPAWLALYPPVAWDDTIYHLPLARSLVEHSRYLFVENLRAPVFPLLAETLFAPALQLGRASTAHGVSLLSTLGTLLLLLLWGRDRFAGAGTPGRVTVWALMPAAIWIGQPIVVFYAGSSFVDPLLTLFVTAAAVAFERWRREPAPAWLLAAGAFAGWAAATKYLGLYAVAALALAVGGAARRGGRRRAMASFAMAALLAGGPWYLLIWLLSGNPVFPFFSSLFGRSEWSGLTAVALNGMETGWAQNAIGVVRLGWDLVADRARVGWQPPASPLVVLALPLLLYLAWRQRWARIWVAMIAGFVLAFFALPRDARYLMLFSPALSVLLVAALRDLAGSAVQRLPRLSRGGGPAAMALVGLSLMAGPAYAVWRTWLVGPPPVDSAAIDRSLARRVPLFRALLFRRDRGYDEVPLYALHGERLHDFAGRALLGEWNGPYRYDLVLPLLDRPEELAARLHELGAGQFLVPRASVAPRVVAALASSPRFRELYRDDEGVLFALPSAD